GQTMAQGLGQAAAPLVPGAAAAGAAGAAGATGGAASADPVQRLQQLKALADQNLITAAEYEAAKAEILKKLTS
ncbi:MAG: SHOCT domain-containing protein, partial [Bordetella sp.]|nr:SHOCT domain-containing protein [Bordetella sp.]